MPNGLASVEQSAAAANAFLTQLNTGDLNLQAGACRHVTDGYAIAQVCNSKNETVVISSTPASTAFNLLETSCAATGSSGQLKTSDGSIYSISYKNVVGSRDLEGPTLGNRKTKRCWGDETIIPVNGCDYTPCSPKITMDANGDCPYTDPDNTGTCSAYCEVRIGKFYGPAQDSDQKFRAVSFLLLGSPGANCYTDTKPIITFKSVPNHLLHFRNTVHKDMFY